MNGTDARQLARVLPKPSPTSVGLPAVARNWALVQSIQYGSPLTLTITLGGSSAPIAGIRCLDSYHPTVGDMVMVDHVERELIVMGSVSGGAGPGLAQRLGYAVVTASSGTFTSQTTIPGLSCTAIVGAARAIVVSVKVRIQSAAGGNVVAGDVFTVYVLRDGAIIDANDYVQPAGAVTPQEFETLDIGPTAGSHTWAVAAARGSSATGTLSNGASATKKSFIRVFDEGAV